LTCDAKTKKPHTFLFVLDKSSVKDATKASSSPSADCYVLYLPDPDARDQAPRNFQIPTERQFDLQLKAYPAAFGFEDEKTGKELIPLLSGDQLKITKMVETNGIYQTVDGYFRYNESSSESPVSSIRLVITFEEVADGPGGVRTRRDTSRGERDFDSRRASSSNLRRHASSSIHIETTENKKHSTAKPIVVASSELADPKARRVSTRFTSSEEEKRPLQSMENKNGSDNTDIVKPSQIKQKSDVAPPAVVNKPTTTTTLRLDVFETKPSALSSSNNATTPTIKPTRSPSLRLDAFEANRSATTAPLRLDVDRSTTPPNMTTTPSPTSKASATRFMEYTAPLKKESNLSASSTNTVVPTRRSSSSLGTTTTEKTLVRRPSSSNVSTGSDKPTLVRRPSSQGLSVDAPPPIQPPGKPVVVLPAKPAANKPPPLPAGKPVVLQKDVEIC